MNALVKVTEPEAAHRVIDCLNAGGVVILPTDTVYGIACAMKSASAFERIYNLKGRESGKPCALLIADLVDAHQYWLSIHAQTLELACNGWPGALTLIGPKSLAVPDYITGGLNKVGLRVPDNDFVREVIRGLGQPLAATSANLAGEMAPLSLASIPRQMLDNADLIIDGGNIKSHGASRVIDASEGDSKILRS